MTLRKVASVVEVFRVAGDNELAVRWVCGPLLNDLVKAAGLVGLVEDDEDIVRDLKQGLLRAEVRADSDVGQDRGVAPGAVAEGDGAEVEGEVGVVCGDGGREVRDIDSRIGLADHMELLGLEMREVGVECL